MSNSYTPTNWVANKTVATADVMNNMEEGILNAHQKLSELDLQIEEIYTFKNESYINIKNYKHLVTDNDWTDAINKAIEVATSLISNNRRVYVPAGTYYTQGIILPSDIDFFGAGKNNTIIKLIPGDKIDKKYKRCLLTNYDWVNGNKNIVVRDMTLDWNNAYSEQFINPGSTSCLFANCKDSIMKNLHACGGGLHGLDISNNRYNPYKLVDGVYYKLDENGVLTNEVIDPTIYKREFRSTNCKIINCSSTGAVDDNITTHHSDLILIENCVSYNPKGRDGGSNTNCYEIDDGSTRVTLNNCYAFGGKCGYEIKAHSHSPSANNVTLNNCKAENNVFSFRIRHIGHRSGDISSDDLGDSLTAFDLELNNCTAINPIRNEVIAPGVTPNALKIYAYRNVNINNFTCIGGEDGINNGQNDSEDNDDSLFNSGSEVIRITSGARNINFNNVSIRDFKNCEQAIYISGGSGGSKINLSNINIYNSGRNGIRIGNSSYTNLNNIRIESSNSDAINGVLIENQYYNLSNVFIDGYKVKGLINNVQYNTFPNKSFGGNSLGSGLTHATHNNSSVIASTAGATASGDKSIVITSSECKSEGVRSAVISSSGATTTSAGSRSTIISSVNSKIENSSSDSVILTGYNVVNNDNNVVCGGYGAGVQSTANKKWQLESITGNIKASGTITGSSTFSDFAEMFENKYYEEIEVGTIVSLDGDKIVKANGDDILGVISKTAVLLAGDTTFSWAGRYMRDEFGGLIYEDVEVLNEDGNVEIMTLPVESSSYDPNKEQIPRSDRKKEWSCVGLIGQVYTRIDDTVNVGDYLSSLNGIGTKSNISTNLKVMRITKSYDGEYGIALCLLK